MLLHASASFLLLMGSSKPELDFLDPPSQATDLGTLGHYRVIEQIGKGGMGYVFRAEDTRLKRTVALKVMNRKIAATPNSRARFISEARSMAAVHHDNVATIFEVGEKNKTPYMAMEMLKGDTLDQFKKAAERPTYQEIIRFAKDIAKGLSAAHSQGIVHRDIKPANMWVEEGSNRIKILDFGLALASTPVDQLSGRGAVIGTPGYLSPEQARSEPLDDRSDLYSVGVVLYELATGKLPLQHKSVAGQLIAILAHDPKPLRDLNPKIPQPLADLIHRLLEKEPRDRIHSAAKLDHELDRVAKDCESSSEMAQTLNRLQMGLNEIVSKKDAPELVDPATPNSPAAPILEPNLAGLDLPDPFSNVPASPTGSGAFPASPASMNQPLASATPGPAPAKTKSNSGPNNQSKKPSVKKATAKKTRGAKTGANASPILKYWPIAAVSLIILAGALTGLFLWMNSDQPVAISDVEIDPIKTSDPLPDSPKPTSPQPKTSNPATSANPASRNQPTGGPKKPKFKPAVSVDAQRISVAAISGAKPLINSQLGNGSFERTDGNPITGSGQFKGKIPGWFCTFKGIRAGFAKKESKSASDGSHYLFVEKKSTAELNSDPLDHVTKVGDRFRVVFDIASVPGLKNRRGKAKYGVILGFKSPGAAVSQRWKLGEIQDQTDIDQGMRTVGFEYVAQEQDANKKPFLRLVVSEGAGNRPVSYMDNVRLAVVAKNAVVVDRQPGSAMPASPDSMTSPDSIASPQSPANEKMVASSPSEPRTSDVSAASNPPSSNPPNPESMLDSAKAKTARVVQIRTSDGNGADVTAKKGANVRDSLGLKPTLAIQMRSDVEVQHSYIRFDLSPISSSKKNQNQSPQRRQKSANRKTGTTKLVLNVTGQTPAAGGVIRVYGADSQAAQAWSEQGNRSLHWNNSYSKSGLDQLPLLAELQIPSDQSGKQLQIESPKLSDFVRQAPLQSVTLVLSGRSANRLPLLFVSRDGDPSLAPCLHVEVDDP